MPIVQEHSDPLVLVSSYLPGWLARAARVCRWSHQCAGYAMTALRRRTDPAQAHRFAHTSVPIHLYGGNILYILRMSLNSWSLEPSQLWLWHWERETDARRNIYSKLEVLALGQLVKQAFGNVDAVNVWLSILSVVIKEQPVH